MQKRNKVAALAIGFGLAISGLIFTATPAQADSFAYSSSAGTCSASATALGYTASVSSSNCTAVQAFIQSWYGNAYCTDRGNKVFGTSTATAQSVNVTSRWGTIWLNSDNATHYF